MLSGVIITEGPPPAREVTMTALNLIVLDTPQNIYHYQIIGVKEKDPYEAHYLQGHMS